MSPDVAIREANDADAAAVNALFKRVFGKERSDELWRWLYRDTPAGQGHSIIAMQEGKVIAHAGTVTRPMRIGEKTVLCGQSIDAMTHPAWQRRGLNQRLGEALSAVHERDGIEAVYGFSNRYSTHTVLTHQKRVALEPFPVLIRPLRYARLPWRFLRRGDRTPAPAAATLEADVSGLWAQTTSPVGIAADAAYLNWRASRPGGTYRVAEVRSEDRLQALGLTSLRTQMGLLTAFVADALVEHDDPAVWRELLAEMAEDAIEQGCDAMSALAFPDTPAHAAYREAGFWPVPPWLNPEDIVVSVRHTSPDDTPSPLHRPSNWALSWGAHDLV